MHRALEIDEILFNIFGHCYPPNSSMSRERTSDLAALARTCRTFKDPALDILWEELDDDLSPIVRCLPDFISQYLDCWIKRYSFRGRFTRRDWDTLQSYTCRIRSISLQNSDCIGLSRKSIIRLSRPPDGKPLFPSLRHLRFAPSGHWGNAKALLRLPLPSLVSLEVNVRSRCFCGLSLESFMRTTPDLRKLSIRASCASFSLNACVCFSAICRWRNLRTVVSPNFSLDAETLLWLSRIPALAELNVALRDTIPEPDRIDSEASILVFPSLRQLRMRSLSLVSCVEFLSNTQLPVVMDIHAEIETRPSREHVTLYVNSQAFGCTVQSLGLFQKYFLYRGYILEGRPLLCLEDLKPYTVFGNLRLLEFNIEWRVDLSDNDLLALASGWPHLQYLLINAEWGWNTQGGITPNGVLLLLRTCRSLTRVALAIDTRGTEYHASPVSLGLTPDPEFSMDVLDSFIEAESVPAVAAFLASFMLPAGCPFVAWKSRAFDTSPWREACKERWDDVFKRVADTATPCP